MSWVVQVERKLRPTQAAFPQEKALDGAYLDAYLGSEIDVPDRRGYNPNVMLRLGNFGRRVTARAI